MLCKKTHRKFKINMKKASIRLNILLNVNSLIAMDVQNIVQFVIVFHLVQSEENVKVSLAAFEKKQLKNN